MSILPTRDPSKAKTEADIAAQTEAFHARGGKVRVAAAGTHALPASIDMHTQHDSSWRARINGEVRRK